MDYFELALSLSREQAHLAKDCVVTIEASYGEASPDNAVIIAPLNNDSEDDGA